MKNSILDVTLRYTYEDGLINIAFFNLYDPNKYLGEITVNENDKTVYLSQYLLKNILTTEKLNKNFYSEIPDKWPKVTEK